MKSYILYYKRNKKSNKIVQV